MSGANLLEIRILVCHEVNQRSIRYDIPIPIDDACCNSDQSADFTDFRRINIQIHGTEVARDSKRVGKVCILPGNKLVCELVRNAWRSMELYSNCVARLEIVDDIPLIRARPLTGNPARLHELAIKV